MLVSCMLSSSLSPHHTLTYRELLVDENNLTPRETENDTVPRASDRAVTAFHVSDVTYRAPKSRVNLCEGT